MNGLTIAVYVFCIYYSIITTFAFSYDWLNPFSFRVWFYPTVDCKSSFILITKYVSVLRNTWMGPV